MHKKNFLFLISFSLIINVIDVFAYQFNQNLIFEIKNRLIDFFIPYGKFNWALMISIVIFIVLAYMFSDALLTFSPLSRKASIAVGVLMAIIALFTGFIKSVTDFLVGITGGLGYWGTVTILIIIVVVYFIWRIFTSFFVKSSRK